MKKLLETTKNIFPRLHPKVSASILINFSRLESKMIHKRLYSVFLNFCFHYFVFFVLLMTKQWLHISVLSVVLNASVMLVENHFHMSNHDSCWQRLMILVGGACSSGMQSYISQVLQRVPTLCGFWDLKKTMLREIRVNGTVGDPLLMQKSPTCAYIRQTLR